MSSDSFKNNFTNKFLLTNHIYANICVCVCVCMALNIQPGVDMS